MRNSKRLFLGAVLLALACAVQAQAGPGIVTVGYTLHRLPGRGSNQLAVWVEDAKGRLVRTLFATDFMARRGGFRLRPQVCPEWVKAAGLERMSPAEIDAVSGATQRPGAISLAWDCKTAAGQPVPPGLYYYKVEGNIYMDKRVLWTGSIRVGGPPSESVATAQFLPNDAAAKAGTIVEGVTARYQP
jgi:hypothetical protein